MVEYQQGNASDGTGSQSPVAPIPQANPAPMPAPTGNPATPAPQAVAVQVSDPGMSGLAIAGMVLGIVGAATSFLPIINNLSFFLGILGLILAIAGLVGVRKGKKKGLGFAIAGIVLGAATIVIVIATQVAFSAAIDSATEALKTKPAATASTSSGTDGSGAVATASASGDGASSAAAAPDSPFTVTIDSATQTTDYSGDPAAVVTFTFTNNSDKATSFGNAVSAKAFQNGVELDMAMVFDEDVSSYINEVKPGATATVQKAFELDDSTPITVEASEWFAFGSDLLAEATFNV